MKVPGLGWTIDERFLVHRQRSTSIGGLAGVAVAAVLFFHSLIARDLLRWDLFAIVMTAALVKLALLTWYRLTD